MIEDFAAGLGVPTPLFSASIPVYSKALAMGFGDRDTASVCAVLEQMAGREEAQARQAPAGQAVARMKRSEIRGRPSRMSAALHAGYRLS